VGDVVGLLRPDSNAVRGTFVGLDVPAVVTTVVVTYNSASDVPLLIDDLRVAAATLPIRLIVVDNQSSDATVETVAAHDDVILVESGGNLGYSGGVNVALRMIGNCEAVLILNPDLVIEPGAVGRLLTAVRADGVGAVVPLILDEDGTIYASLRREPSILRSLGDAFLGGKMLERPSFLAEIDARASSYERARDVDWATGAAMMIPATVVREVGMWNESFFLYSEEVDYCRRIRDRGYRIRFDPDAVVKHRRGGSGTSPDVLTLMTVNHIRYVEIYHGRLYSALFRAVIALGGFLRAYSSEHRRVLAVVLSRRRWQSLPKATRPVAKQMISGARQRGAIIVPAYNEASVIMRTLTPLSQGAVEGFFEIIVVCNGCTDETAALARSVPGIQVVELTEGSKPAALNEGDRMATLWPRLYLDADIHISTAAVLAVLDRLDKGDVLVARPESRYDFGAASALVRSYYRARERVIEHKTAMWGAGAYALNEKAHGRMDRFPMFTGDDLYVDAIFAPHEKTVVATEPSVVTTPATVGSLLAIMRRSHRAFLEISHQHIPDARVTRPSSTARAVLRTIRGPGSALDAGVYLAMALAGRISRGDAPRWERDESSRSTD
jgi:GT2 family glycosyltransferase